MSHLSRTALTNVVRRSITPKVNFTEDTMFMEKR